MTLREKLNAAVKDAMRAREPRKVSTLRLILASVKDRDIVRRTEADERDDDVIISEIMTRMIKQRQDSITAYEEGGRLELAEKEREEIAVIEGFLPRQLGDDEILAACKAVVEELEATSLKDIGRCMAVLKERYAGKMDFSKASKQIKALLSQ
ncbi:aspartyl-tRNA amidotransferase subunit B [Iodidimonas muriae]|uniref:Aspartyl-tRNA amidotransferase subunit B n=2 Tax=Iodidimonas TaxID=2066486 RepID=A0A5A7MUD6_9PROT|nr:MULTISPECIES: GatB/YqeY domain-containing protein [Iodidimonas]GEQ99521.1 aspartyl-tRNA amidotransferase subunit B [Iodidimonas gelatinilytica]GER07376.1 aspartyl-tRNA amidotransferase subunit B [Kordiimonadales bacterium JCM 17843]GGO10766.1 aspartyl-tRNA amidotransferase subunit B [Iodidimonas muriae]